MNFTRRTVLRSLVGGSMLMPAILSRLAAEQDGDPLAPKSPHFAPKAKRVIWLYMTGGVSHTDSFDPKPKLRADHNKRLAGDMFAIGGKWGSRPHGESGIEVSELFPHVASCVDDICVIRSMHTDNNDHFQATLGIHTGSVTVTRPSIGSWVSYGLGTENRNLPSFVVIAPRFPYAGGQVWGSDFLPAAHQGARIVPGAEPIPNMTRRAPSAEIQQMELGLLEYFNRRHYASRDGDTLLAARIRNFETGFGMQTEAPEVFDLSREWDRTLRLYGLERGSTEGFGW